MQKNERFLIMATGLFIGAAVGALAQRTRLCMVGGIRDLILFREPKLILGFAAIFLAALAGNGYRPLYRAEDS